MVAAEQARAEVHPLQAVPVVAVALDTPDSITSLLLLAHQLHINAALAEPERLLAL